MTVIDSSLDYQLDYYLSVISITTTFVLPKLTKFHPREISQKVIFLVNGLGEIKAIRSSCTETSSLVVLLFLAFFSFMEGMTTDNFSEVFF